MNETKIVPFDVEPPHANRGAQSTTQNSLSACVDWLSVTFLDEQNFEECIDVFGLDPGLFVEMKKGRYGYRKMVQYNYISVLYDGREDMGVHVELSGQGCRYFEQESDICWNELFVRLVTDFKHKVNINRLDLAIDDTVGYFKITQAINNVKRGNCVSLFRKARRISNLNIQQGGEFGHTLYFGSPSSKLMFRFYDKLEEMKAKKKVVSDDIEIWNRIEVSLQDERAESVVQILAEETLQVGEIVRGLLKHYIKFKSKSKTDKNIYRWPLTPWYKKFLDDVQPLRITTKTPDRSIQRIYSWINKSVIKSFAMLAITFNDNLEDMLNDFLTDGQDKLTQTDWNIIDDFKKSGMDYFEFLNYLRSLDEIDFKEYKERIKKSVPETETEKATS